MMERGGDLRLIMLVKECFRDLTADKTLGRVLSGDNIPSQQCNGGSDDGTRNVSCM